jgi:hypothetical protein
MPFEEVGVRQNRRLKPLVRIIPVKLHITRHIKFFIILIFWSFYDS